MPKVTCQRDGGGLVEVQYWYLSVQNQIRGPPDDVLMDLCMNNGLGSRARPDAG